MPSWDSNYVWIVGHNEFDWRVKCRSLSEAEAHIGTVIEARDPLGVHAGDYYIDGPCDPEGLEEIEWVDNAQWRYPPEEPRNARD